MKYDYYLQIGKEEKKFNSKREALTEAFTVVKENPKMDIALFSKCKGERTETIPSVKAYIASGVLLKQLLKNLRLLRLKKKKKFL